MMKEKPKRTALRISMPESVAITRLGIVKKPPYNIQTKNKAQEKASKRQRSRRRFGRQ